MSYLEKMDISDDDFNDTNKDYTIFTQNKHKAYKILTEEDVRRHLDDDITTVCSLLPVSRGEARILLINFNWNVDDLTGAWFADEEKVRKTFGLLKESNLISLIKGEVNNFTCSICFTTYSPCDMRSTSCGHLFCESCYKSYVEFKILEGPGCVSLKCPQSDCVAVVGDDMIETMVSDECRKRFNFYIVRSYLEKKRDIKWCPAPGCDYAIEFELGSDCSVVKCDCSNIFCWDCAVEIHRPVDCKTAKAWLSMINDVSANSLWLFAYTKPCPKCKNPIEKNRGCMHMSCPVPCSHQFCWMCLGDWSEHNQDYFKCNIYNEQAKNGWTEPEVNKREVAKYLKRYGRYFEKWALNQSLKDKAEENLKNWTSKDLGEEIAKYHGNTKCKLQFITEALLQIVECRRVLKWIHAYAFYMNEGEKIKRRLFGYLQGEAEAGLERLNRCLEDDLPDYLNAGGRNHGIKLKVITLTKVTKKFFENLVRAMEKGLDDMDDPSYSIKRSKTNPAYGGESSNTRYDDDDDDDDDDAAEEYPDGWDCRHCTYYNHNHAGEDCEMCALPTE